MVIFTNILKKYSSFFLLSILISTAFIPRLWKLTDNPPIIVDEPANLRDINKLLSMPGFHPADFEWSGGQGTLVFYPTITLIKVGITEQFLALRLTAVILSILALIPFFFITKKYTNTLIAFCTTLLFSFSYYYLQFSRVGWTNIHALSLGLYFLWIVELSLKKKYFIGKVFAAGLLAGLLFYTYRAAEVYIFAGFLNLFSQIIKLKEELARKIMFSLIFIVSFMIIASPWMNTAVHNWNFFTLRSRVISVFNTSLPYHGLYDKNDILIYQIITTIKSWIFLLPIDGGGIENKRYLPLVYPPISFFLIPLFIFGLVLSLYKYSREMRMWFIIFFLGLLFGQALTVDPPNGSRGLILLPTIYLFCGLTLHYFYNKLKNKPLIDIFFIATIILIAASDFNFYKYWMSWIRV